MEEESFINKIIEAQRGEITEYHVYLMLASICKDEKNKKILKQIAVDELKHYNILKSITKTDVPPDKLKIFIYKIIAFVFGLTFTLRLMEGGESNAQRLYTLLAEKNKKIGKIIKDEEMHEDKLIHLLNDVALDHISDIVLGLNDALVELTGTLAGLTLAISNNTIIAITGIVMGTAAALSMAASSYLSARERNHEKPMKAALYTGITYIIAVIILVLPYLIINEPISALGLMLLFTIIMIAIYNFYVSVAKAQSFKKRFIEMAIISLSVAVLSFVIGVVVKRLIGADI